MTTREPELPSHIFTCGMSRSGTTLLTTILDAHPAVSMGYELLPRHVNDAGAAAEAILATDTDDRDTCTEALRARGLDQLAVLVHRAHRTLVSPRELAAILADFAARGQVDLTDNDGQVALSLAITDTKARKEGTSITGFKAAWPRLELHDKAVGDPSAAYVFILRDPRDVWASHVENQFPQTIDHVAYQWNRYLRQFEAFARRNPERTHLLRYEDLVAAPRESIDAMCAAIGLPRDAAMDRFYESKASVIAVGGHGNSEQLSQDFFTSSTGRWQEDLSDSDVRTLEIACYDGMEAHGYARSTNVGFQFQAKEWRKHRARVEKLRRFYAEDWEDLVLPAVESYAPRTLREATDPAQAAADEADEILLIRHDIDRDMENAVKLAHWEHERGIRATYCVLHTAFYYGRHDHGQVTAHSERMVEAALEIQSLGHEVSLHNDAITVGLLSGADPYDVLAAELEYLRSRGLAITGSSAHGAMLCREVGYRNTELFAETTPHGPRTIEYRDNRITVGTRPMADFGLEYEGYDVPFDAYFSEVGGSLTIDFDTPGRAGVRRADMANPPAYKRMIGILAHPVKWDLDKRAPRGHNRAPSFHELMSPSPSPTTPTAEPVRRRRFSLLRRR